MFKRLIMFLVALAVPIALAAQESPLTIVAKVLSLSDEQTQALGHIVQARGEAIGPAMQEAQKREQALGQQLQSSNPDPLIVGRLVIEIGMAPVKPAEFVIFRIFQWAPGQE